MMNWKQMVGAAIGLVFVFIIAGASLGVTSNLVGKVTAAIDTNGPLAAFSTPINSILTGVLDAGNLVAQLLPLAVLVAAFGVSKLFE